MLTCRGGSWLAGVLLLCTLSDQAQAARRISPREYLRHVKYLSSDKLRGRATGSPELDTAASYLARQFAAAKLQPVSGSYFQQFPVSVDSQLVGDNRFSYDLDGTAVELELHKDFIPLSFSGAGSLDGAVVFAGYGITAAEYGYDDYQGLDVRGKMALILTHEPTEFQRESIFEGRVYSEHAQLQSKVLNARAHGAAGVILVADSANHAYPDKLEPFISTVGPANPGMPVVNVRAHVADKWFAATGRNFENIQHLIDREERPASFAFPPSLRVTLQTTVEHRPKLVKNVVGFLAGETDEYVIVGAHYDHLGLGEQYSLAPEKVGTAHPGADDNASGTAGLISLARALGYGPKLRRGVLFVAFAGEELGLLGSSHYVTHPVLPLAKTRLMINMDMIGRIGAGRVAVGGAGSTSPYRRVLERLETKHAVKLNLDETAVYGSSDHTSFRSKLIPFLFFFSGLHGDYHRPTDTWDKIDAAGAARLLNLIADLVADPVTRSKLQFAEGSAGGAVSTGQMH